MQTKTLANVVVLLSLFMGSSLAAPLGAAFTYQGKLTDGGPPANGSYDLRFILYDADVGGNQVGPIYTNAAVPVSGGFFVVSLDFGGGVFTGNLRWLEIDVRTNGGGAFTTLSARQPLTPAPYALYTPNAGAAASATSATTAGTATVANAVANGSVFAAGLAPGQVVKSLNGLHDDVTLAAGTNVTLTPSGQTLTLASPTDWHAGGNAGTTAGANFLGTTDNQPIEFKVNSARALRLEPTSSSVNVLGGFGGNSVGVGTQGATIAGGGTSGQPNGIGANSTAATIAGGVNNQVQDAAAYTAIGGGANNVIQYGAVAAEIGGGQNNTIQSNALYGVIAGGNQNQIQGATNTGYAAQAAAILGGYGNTIEAYAYQATIGGGNLNRIQYDADRATIAGGLGNIIGTNANNATIGGGANNVVSNQASYATVPGGNLNTAGQIYSFAAGNRAKALHQGTFVWSDSQSVDFSSTGNNQFLIRAGGNVGVNKNNPATALDVNGTITAANFVGSGAGLTSVAQLNANQTFGGSLTFLGNVDFGTNAHLNDHDLFMRWDQNHGIGWYGAGKPFAGLNIDGPVVYGWTGGALGSTGSGQKAWLSWDSAGKLSVDPGNLNDGAITPGLSFGQGSGEGMASKRTATGNQYGLDFYTGYANRMSVTQNGNIGIGTNAPSVRLEVVGTGSVTTSTDGFVDIGPANSWHITMGTQDIQVKNTPTAWDTLYLNWYGGNVSVASTNLYVSAGSGVSVNTRYNNGYRFYVNGTTFSTGGWGGSDARWKRNIQPLTGALNKVLRLQGVNFEWRRDEFPGQEFGEGLQLGFVAQEVERVLPEAVHTDTEGYKAIAYEKLTAVLNEAIKEQQAELGALQGRNAALEKDVAELKGLVLALAAKLNGGGQ